jgi:hypothetical protein
VFPVPVFFTVIAWLALVLPTAVAGKVNVVGVAVTVTVAAAPVPVRPTDWGEFVAWSVIEIEPVRVPVVVGVNATVSVQLPPDASVLEQLLVCAKSPVAAPIESGVATAPLFFTVTCWLELVVPTVCEGNVKLDGVGVTITVPVPLPERLIICGEFVAWSVTEMLPERGPATEGVKVTLSVQLAPASNRFPQLLTWAKLPVMEMAIDVYAEPVFCTLTLWKALVTPTAVGMKVRLVGVAVTVVVAGVAVPDKVTTCGEFVALSKTEIFPVRFPAAFGVNVGVMVQVAPAANVDGATGQLFVWPKLELAEIETVVAVLLPVFFMVIVEPVLVAFKTVEGKVTLVGVAVTVVAPFPAPWDTKNGWWAKTAQPLHGAEGKFST